MNYINSWVKEYNWSLMGEKSKKQMDAHWMHEWFKHLWDQREDENGYIRCFECYKPMHRNTYREISSCYSHILSKKIYPDFAGKASNIVIVHPDCHHLYTMKPLKAINQYARYLQLKQAYSK